MRLKEKCQVCGKQFWYWQVKKFPNGILVKSDLTYKKIDQICNKCLSIEQERQHLLSQL
jgi:hypothetical protein